jgi:hypothetical protein
VPFHGVGKRLHLHRVPEEVNRARLLSVHDRGFSHTNSYERGCPQTRPLLREDLLCHCGARSFRLDPEPTFGRIEIPHPSFGRNRDTKCGIVQGGPGRLWC